MPCQLHFKSTSARVKLNLLRGVIRRLFLITFRKAYVAKRLNERQGECLRCGACCHLVANKCMGLHFQTDGKSACRFYSFYRPPNCRIFPIDARDIADRDQIVSHHHCGYSWPK